MTWILLAAGLGVAGVLALLVAGARVIRAARRLNREVAGARARLAAKSARIHSPEDETHALGAYDRA
ncbi:LapA family protein [Nonomuraea indica]|uniref:LapA family protein n=1 Tax=Nonomuraea indica TaxID=1581193 RepID=A0ABW8A730_9ACTN|nr:LapA family protein [Nonomuraea indica]